MSNSNTPININHRYTIKRRNVHFFNRYGVYAGNGTRELFVGSKSECENIKQLLTQACLDGAFIQKYLSEDSQ